MRQLLFLLMAILVSSPIFASESDFLKRQVALIQEARRSVEDQRITCGHLVSRLLKQDFLGSAREKLLEVENTLSKRIQHYESPDFESLKRQLAGRSFRIPFKIQFYFLEDFDPQNWRERYNYYEADYIYTFRLNAEGKLLLHVAAFSNTRGISSGKEISMEEVESFEGFGFRSSEQTNVASEWSSKLTHYNYFYHELIFTEDGELIARLYTDKAYKNLERTVRLPFRDQQLNVSETSTSVD